MSDINNAAKVLNPITTDSQMLPIIRKLVNNSKAADKEDETAKRLDLRDKELQQASVLEAYIEDGNVLNEEDIKVAVQHAVESLEGDGRKITKGDLMKSLVGTNGSLSGLLVEKKDLARIVDAIVQRSSA